MDCPNPSCEGWLLFFANQGETTPLFLRCVFSAKNEAGKGTCQPTMIFAKRESICSACDFTMERVTVATYIIIHY